MTEYFEIKTNGSTLFKWKSKALSNETIKPSNINLLAYMIFMILEYY